MTTKGRFKDSNWDLADAQGNVGTWERVGIAVLMDIRDELKQLNGYIGCHNAIEIPSILRRIEMNTKKKPRTKKV